MAEIIENSAGKKGGKKGHLKKHSTRIDMTPMVDLACLLLTFFMLTTAFSKPKTMEIVMPEKDKDNTEKNDGPKVSAERTINILISGNDAIYYYFGVADKKKGLPQLVKTTYGKDGIRKLLLKRNEKIFKEIYELKEKIKTGEINFGDTTEKALKNKIRKIKKSDEDAPIILIKADEFAKYKNIVDVIDEMAIANIASYAIVDINSVEIEMIKNASIK